jgi:hypothetical protein
MPGGVGGGSCEASPYPDSPALRRALEDALARHGVRAVILDEGQHLMNVASGAKLLDQLDWIKSMTNVTGVVHVLVGTYDLLDFRNLNGQAARRGYDMHFPRYRLQYEADRQAFQGALHSLLLQIRWPWNTRSLWITGTISTSGALAVWGS